MIIPPATSETGALHCAGASRDGGNARKAHGNEQQQDADFDRDHVTLGPRDRARHRATFKPCDDDDGRGEKDVIPQALCTFVCAVVEVVLRSRGG